MEERIAHEIVSGLTYVTNARNENVIVVRLLRVSEFPEQTERFRIRPFPSSADHVPIAHARLALFASTAGSRAFVLKLAANAIGRVWNCIQAFSRDLYAAIDAAAESALFDTFERCGDHFMDASLRRFDHQLLIQPLAWFLVVLTRDMNLLPDGIEAAEHLGTESISYFKQLVPIAVELAHQHGCVPEQFEPRTLA
jgi:hypothetical protein